jgi:DNA-binding transcriptional LysR family regulator
VDLFASMNAFVAVVDDGAFTKAARRLGVAASSVARQVDSLEAHLQATLLNRSTRSVTLTDTGQVYYDNAVRILQELTEANNEATNEVERPNGLLRVSLPVAFAQLYIVPYLREFLDTYPLVELDINLTDQVVNLVDDRTDLAIRIGNVEPPTLISRRLCSSRRVVCATPGYLVQAGTPASPEDLRGHNCLPFSYSRSNGSWKFTNGASSCSVRVKGNLKANSSILLREAALAGCGVALLPLWLVHGDLQRGDLVAILGNWDVTPSIPGEVYAVYLPNRKASTKVRAFIDFFVVKLRHLDEQQVVLTAQPA